MRSRYVLTSDFLLSTDLRFIEFLLYPGKSSFTVLEVLFYCALLYMGLISTTNGDTLSVLFLIGIDYLG